MSATVLPQGSASPIAGSWSVRDSARIRLGGLCLLAAALLELLGILYRGPLTSPGRAPAAFMAVSASPNTHLAWGLLLSGEMLACLGWLATYCWQRHSAQERAAFWGTLLMLVSLIVFLPVWGAFGITSHEAALAEQAGQHGAVALVAATAEGPMARKFLLISVFSALIGVIIWARVLWRVRTVRWIAPLLILHTVTQDFTSVMFSPWGYRLERLGAAVFVLICVALAFNIWRDMATERGGLTPT